MAAFIFLIVLVRDQLPARAMAAEPFLNVIRVGPFSARLAVDERTSRAFVSDNIRTVQVLDTHSGKVLSTVKVGTEPKDFAVSIRTNRVFVANLDSATVSMLDATTGLVLRTIPVGLFPESTQVDARTDHAFVLTDDVYRDGTVHNGGVFMLDAKTGAVLHTVGVGRGPHQLWIDSTARHAFVSNAQDRTTSVIDTRNGALVATSIAYRSPAFRVVDVRSGRSFALSSIANTVIMRQARTGRVLRIIRLGNAPAPPHYPFPLTPVGVAADPRTGRLFVISRNTGMRGFDRYPGTLTEIDTRTGSVRHILLVSGGPRAIALDCRTGHLFILTGVDPRHASPASNTAAIAMLGANALR
jgi:YVTN family beta-propeller protein